jgi:hypothetical protein
VASDADQDLLTYTWTDSAEPEQALPPVPDACISVSKWGAHTFTVVVDDGHGHRATDSVTYTFVSPNPPTVSVTAPAAGAVVPTDSPVAITWTAASHNGSPLARIDVAFSLDDGAVWEPIAECLTLDGSATSCQWNSVGQASEQARIRVTAIDSQNAIGTGDSGRFSIRSGGGGGSLPAGWLHADIGAVGAAGSASVTNGMWTVKGSGADIWGTADEFHYAWLPVIDDQENWFEVIGRVAAVQNVNQWTKVGLMVRSPTAAANAPHASLFVRPRRQRASHSSVGMRQAGSRCRPRARRSPRRSGSN